VIVRFNHKAEKTSEPLEKAVRSAERTA
jgi:hypothetical protein